MGLISFAGKVIDWNRNLESVMGARFGESRTRAYTRRLRRMSVSESKIKHHLKEAEEKGGILKTKKGLTQLVKILHREGKLIFQILDKEDIVEYDAVEKLIDCEKSVERSNADNKAEVIKRLRVMLKLIKEFAELELGKVSYLMEGGRPWEGLANIASWDMGTTENVVLGEAWKQRSMISNFSKAVERVSKSAEDISNEKRAKVPRIDKIREMQEKQEKSLRDLESAFKTLGSSIKLQFYCVLRLIDFHEQELKSDEGIIVHYKQEGFPGKTADKMKEDYIKEIDAIKKKESEEQGRLRLIANAAARGL